MKPIKVRAKKWWIRKDRKEAKVIEKMFNYLVHIMLKEKGSHK